MNIQLFNQDPTMTSREIADLTEKEHAHVMRDIHVMFFELGIETKGYIQDWIHPQNKQTYQEFRLSKDLTLTLISGYSIALRKRIIDKWIDLEKSNKIQLPDFSNPAAAARAWADEVEAKQAALFQLEAAKPALEFVDRYVDSTGLKGFRQVAKLLNIKEPDLRAFLDDKQIMYKLSGEWVPYACHIDAGRFAVKAGTADNGHAFNSAKFTTKGIKWLAGEIAKSKVSVV